MTYCILQTNLLLRSSSQPTTAGKGEAERQKLDRGVDEFKRSSRIQTVLSGLLLQHAGAGEEPLRTCTFIFGITQLVKHNQTSTYFFFFFSGMFYPAEHFRVHVPDHPGRCFGPVPALPGHGPVAGHLWRTFSLQGNSLRVDWSCGLDLEWWYCAVAARACIHHNTYHEWSPSLLSFTLSSVTWQPPGP